MKRKVVIVQPHLPAYRVAFFEKLRQRLAEQDVECLVAAGRPKGVAAQRGDAVHPEWLVPIEGKSLSIGKRSLKLGIHPQPWAGADAVILGLEGSALPVYQALCARWKTGVRVGLWGHIRPYVSPGHKVDLWLEKWQMRLADRIFSYTAGGYQYAVHRGIEPAKITTVMNSMDTVALENARRNLSKNDIKKFATEMGIDPQKTLCYIGGLDASKRIQFLAEALNHVWQHDTSVRFLVGGDGPQKHLLKAAFDRGQALDLGYLDTERKALVMSVSRYVAMPGRIGLIAVDALVLRRPIVTTAWSYHAPEVEYLEEGVTRFTSQDDPQSFAEEIIRALHSPSYSDEEVVWPFPTLDDMVDNFAAGLILLLADKSKNDRTGTGAVRKV